MAKDPETNGSLMYPPSGGSGIDLWIGGEQREDTITSAFRMSGKENHITPGDLTESRNLRFGEKSAES